MTKDKHILLVLGARGPLPGRELRAIVNSGRPWWRRMTSLGFYIRISYLVDNNKVVVRYEDGSMLRQGNKVAVYDLPRS